MQSMLIEGIEENSFEIGTDFNVHDFLDHNGSDNLHDDRNRDHLATDLTIE